MKMNAWVLFIVLAAATACLPSPTSAALVFSDDFNRSDSSTLGNNWVETSTGGGNAKIANNQLQIDNGTPAGRTYVSQDTRNFGSGYTPQLNQNAGTITWTFNMRANRNTLSGFTGGDYGIAFVLGTSSSDFLAGTGYAIVWGQSGTDPLRLVRYTAGLTTGSTISSVITGSGSPFGDMGMEFLSLKVTYNPANNGWELLARNDSSSFADPSAGSFTSMGTATDSTYVNTSLNYMGALWDYNTAAGQSAFYDNLTITAVPEPTHLALGFFGLGLLAVSGTRAWLRARRSAR